MSKNKDLSIIQLNTGNDTLDELLRGGININSNLEKHGIVVVIRGQGGTGKTTLALQITHAMSYSYSKHYDDFCDSIDKYCSTTGEKKKPKRTIVNPKVTDIESIRNDIITDCFKDDGDSCYRLARYTSTENTGEDLKKRLSRLVVAKDMEDCCQETGFPYAFVDLESEKKEGIKTWAINHISIEVLENDSTDTENCYSFIKFTKRVRINFDNGSGTEKSFPQSPPENGKLKYDRYTSFALLLIQFISEIEDLSGGNDDESKLYKRRDLFKEIERRKVEIVNEIADANKDIIILPWIKLDGKQYEEDFSALQTTDTATAVSQIQREFNDYFEKSTEDSENGGDWDPQKEQESITESQKNLSGQRPLIYTIDGLGAVVPEERNNKLFSSLISNLRRLVPLSIITLEDSDNDNDFIDHQADLVIVMRSKDIEVPINYQIHELKILKSRYQQTAYGWHQYKMRPWGIGIFPSSHFMLHKFNYVPQQLIKSYAPIRLRAVSKTDDKQVSTTDNEQNSKTKEKENKEKHIHAYYSSIIEGVLGLTYDNRQKSPGSTIALMGSRGCFKTALSIDFLTAGGLGITRNYEEKEKDPEDHTDKPQHGLIVSLVDDEYYIRERMVCQRRGSCGSCDFINKNHTRIILTSDLNVVKEGSLENTTKLECEECSKRVTQFYQRTGCITSSELLWNLRERLNHLEPDEKSDSRKIDKDEEKGNHSLLQKPGNAVERLVFWDVTQLDYRFPFLAADPLFIPALFDLVKSKSRLNGLFMGSMNAGNSPVISTIADNIIFAWRDTSRLQLTQTLRVKKKSESDSCIINGDSITLYFSKPKKEEMTWKSIHCGKNTVYCDSSIIKNEYGKELYLNYDVKEGIILNLDSNGNSLKTVFEIEEKEPELLIQWINSTSELSFNEECLLLFVDRTEGNIGRNNKALYRFEIVDRSEPDNENQKRKRSSILFPRIPWRPIDYLVETNEYKRYYKARKMIDKIDKLQGLQ